MSSSAQEGRSINEHRQVIEELSDVKTAEEWKKRWEGHPAG